MIDLFKPILYMKQMELFCGGLNIIPKKDTSKKEHATFFDIAN